MAKKTFFLAMLVCFFVVCAYAQEQRVRVVVEGAEEVESYEPGVTINPEDKAASPIKQKREDTKKELEGLVEKSHVNPIEKEVLDAIIGKIIEVEEKQQRQEKTSLIIIILLAVAVVLSVAALAVSTVKK